MESFQGFRDDIADGHAGIQAGQRVLKNNLQVFSFPVHLRLAERAKIFAQPEDSPSGGFYQLENCPGQRGFSAAGFTHDPDGLALVNPEADAVHGPEIGNCRSEK